MLHFMKLVCSLLPLASSVSPDDLKSIVLELKDLNHRVDFLVKDLEHYVALGQLILAAVCFVGLAGLAYLWRHAKRKIDEQIKVCISAAQAKISKIDELVSIANANVVDSRVRWETGDYTIKFIGHNYIAVTIPFKTTFREAPQIFIGECAAGNWIFVKVDEKSKSSFKFAARTLDGAPANYETHIQWLAILHDVSPDSRELKEFVPIPAESN